MKEAKIIQRRIDDTIEAQLISARKLSIKNAELKQEVEKLTELKQISETQIEALGSMLRKEMDEYNKKSLKANIAVGAIFFFAGIIFTIVIQFFI